MAKRKEVVKQEETRKQARLRRHDAERNRRAIIILLAAGALLVLLIAAGIIQELVIKPNQPVATVNGAKISTRLYQQVVKYNWWQAGEVTDPEGTGSTVLDQLIETELLRQQAAERNITVSEDEVGKAIEQMFGYVRETPTPAPTATLAPTATPDPAAAAATAVPTATPAPTATPMTLEAYQEAYKNFLARMGAASGLSEANFRNLVEGQLLSEKLYKSVSEEVPTTGEQVRARHILVAIITPAPAATPDPSGAATPTPDPNATPTPEPRDEAQALARIIEVQQKLGAGEDFAALAKEYSDDPGSKDAGGELGWFSRGSGLIQEFEDAAFGLQAGQTSQPVKTQYGYHLIQVEERDPARTLDAYTLYQRQYEAYQTWLTDLKAAAAIDNKWTAASLPPTPSAVTAQ